MATINRHWLATVTLKTQPMFRKGRLVNETTAWLADDQAMLYRFLQEHYRRRKYWKLVYWVEVVTDEQPIPLNAKRSVQDNHPTEPTSKSDQPAATEEA